MKTATILSLLPLALAGLIVKKREGGPAPLHTPSNVDNLIPGQYIVKMKEDAVFSMDSAMSLFEGEAMHTWYDNGFQGFAAKLDAAALEAIQNYGGVEFIEQDAVVSLQAYETEDTPAWGLGRISHQKPITSHYTYDDSAGEDVCVYIIDTGILTTHEDFDERANFLVNYTDDEDDTDGNGHGTHVAGTVGGSTYGVAKQASLFAVKVLDAAGSGTNSGVIAGMNFVTKDSKTRTCPKGSVANMSLGGGKSAALNAAAAAMVKAGVFLVAAAGNSMMDAKLVSPASEPTVCTVGATDKKDRFSPYSNFGGLVDVLAPGTDILSAWIEDDCSSHTTSGTSMAAPHVAGLGAYFLSLLGSRTPAQLCDHIQNVSTKNKIAGLPAGTKNYLAFNGNPTG